MDWTGRILDQHDDFEKGVLTRVFPEDSAPDLLKQAQLLTQEQVAILPNDAFALCAVDNGQLFRKFAMVDKPMTALSVVYFMETGDQLPIEAQKTAAANLVAGCVLHDIEPPDPLRKLAEGAEDPLIVDTSGKEAPLVISPPGSDKVQLDSAEKTAEACTWFDENQETLHPRDRHKTAAKLLNLAVMQGVEVSDDIKRYGSDTYAPSLKLAYVTRKGLLGQDDTDGLGLLDDLFGKAASVNPEQFAEALCEFDVGMGYSQYWDRSLPDPWYSTFGQMKVAEYVYIDGNDRVTGHALQMLAQNPLVLYESLPRDFVEAFKMDPVVQFEALPLAHKKIIMRVASDPYPQGGAHRTGS